MNDIFLSIVVSGFTVALLTLLFTLIPEFKKNKGSIVKKSAIFGLSAIAVFVSYGALFHNISSYDKKPSVITILIITAASYLGFVISGFIKNENLKKYAKRCAVLCITLFLAEGFIFNFKSLNTNTYSFKTLLSSAHTTTPDTVQINDDGIKFIGNGTVVFDVNRENINAMQLQFDGNDQWFKCVSAIIDNNFSASYINVGNKYASTKYGNLNFSFNTYQKLKSVQLTLSEVSGDVNITSCTFRAALPFEFSNLRFICLFVLLAALLAVITFKLYTVVYNRNSLKHKLIIGSLILLCALSIFSFYIPDQSNITYDEQTSMIGKDPYVQMFDAVHNKQLNINIEPSQELLNLQNPYDSSLRRSSNVKFAWDRAFYNGKYYSYYGIAPVFVFYYPFYWITGDLPTLNMASAFFGFLGIIFLCGTILSFIKRFIKQPNFLLLILFLIASCFTCGIYFFIDFSSFYTLAGIASTCFLFLCLWCGFEACNAKSNKKQFALFALCGIAFILCFSSRPTKALSALILAPVFLGVLFNKNLKLKSKIYSVASFIIPVIIGMSAIMWYNYARFDSPFDFGATYQLTVSDINANKVRLTMLPYALIHYFLQPLNITGTFPYIDINPSPMDNYGNYIYSDFSIGVMTFPLIFAGLIVFPFFMYHFRRKKGEKFVYNELSIKKYTYIIILILSLLLAWVDFCVAGVILNYVFDITPIFTLMSVFIMLETQQLTSKIPAIANKSTFAFSSVAVLTAIVVFAELLSLYELALQKHFPDIMFVLEDITCFWN